MSKIMYNHDYVRMQYDSDALLHDKPWELYQVYISHHVGWSNCINPITWDPETRYRRHPNAEQVTVFHNDYGWVWVDRSVLQNAPKLKELTNDQLQLF